MWKPEYFVSLEPSQAGGTISYGPFILASEARDCFEETYPAFDGGSVTLIKVESTIPGVSPSQLRTNALREEWEIHVDPEKQHLGRAYSQSVTLLGRDVWDVSQDQAGMIYRHAGKKYEPSFLSEIQTERNAENDASVSRLARLLQQGIEVAKINPACERGTPMQAKQITHGIEIEL